MPKEHLAQTFNAQFERDTYGCGAQFSQTDIGYPQGKDIDRDLSDGQRQLGQPRSPAKASTSCHTSFQERSRTGEQQYMPVSREFSKQSCIKDIAASQAAQSGPISMWQHVPHREMPWDGVGAVCQGKHREGSGKGPRSGNASFVSATEGSLEGTRSRNNKGKPCLQKAPPSSKLTVQSMKLAARLRADLL